MPPGRLDRLVQLIDHSTLVMPMQDAGARRLDEHRVSELGDLGQAPLALLGCAQSRARTTSYRPTGKPRADISRFVYSLSMPTAEASTPEPTYGVPASSSRPCRVPSSP